MKNLFKNYGVKIAAAVLMTGFVGLYHTAHAQEKETVTATVGTPTNLDVRSNADYPGGMDEFYGYLASRIKPDTTCIPGRKVYVMFMIDKDGKIKHAKIRSHALSDKMNAQLVKIFESSPNWKPANQNGQEIKSHFVCPVLFMPKTDMIAVNKPVKN